MRTETYDAHGEDILSLALHGKPTATSPNEVRWLVAKLRNVPGNVAEIGTFRGETAVEFAKAYPTRTIYAVDLPITDSKNYQVGKSEAAIGELARGEPNVKVLTQGRAFAYTPDKNIGFVFIDGDHSWEGVRFDTEKALHWFRPDMRYHSAHARQGIIAWHDAIPAWPGDFHMQVYNYLHELSTTWPIVRVEDTSLAYLNL